MNTFIIEVLEYGRWTMRLATEAKTAVAAAQKYSHMGGSFVGEAGRVRAITLTAAKQKDTMEANRLLAAFQRKQAGKQTPDFQAAPPRAHAPEPDTNIELRQAFDFDPPAVQTSAGRQYLMLGLDAATTGRGQQLSMF